MTFTPQVSEANVRKRKQARKHLVHINKIMNRMVKYLNTPQNDAVELAEAFFHVLSYHLTDGDLRPDNVNMARLLRAQEK